MSLAELVITSVTVEGRTNPGHPPPDHPPVVDNPLQAPCCA